MRFCKPKGLLSIIKQLSIMTIIYCWRQPNDEWCAPDFGACRGVGPEQFISHYTTHSSSPNSFSFFDRPPFPSDMIIFLTSEDCLLESNKLVKIAIYFLRIMGLNFIIKTHGLGPAFYIARNTMMHWRYICSTDRGGFVPRGLYVEIKNYCKD